MHSEAPVSSVPSKRPSADDFAAMADNLPELAWIADAAGSIFWYNRKWYEYTGAQPGEMTGWDWQSVHDPKNLPDVLERWKRSISSGEPFQMVFPLRGADGLYRPFLTRAQPLHGPDGRVERWFGVNSDISQQQSALDALANEKRVLQTLNKTASLLASELDLSKLVQIVVDAGVALTGAAFGAFFYNKIDESGERYTLYAISENVREDFAKFPMPRNTGVFGPTFRGEAIVRSDDITKDPAYGHNAPYSGMPDGHLPVRSYLAAPVLSRSGEVLGGIFFGHPQPGVFKAHHEELILGVAGQAATGIDNARLYDAAQREIRERRAIEQHRELLINELNHRVKNTLATVQSIAAQTLRSRAVPEGAREDFEARLIALSEAHNLLTRANWESATLGDVIEVALRPHRAQEGDRFMIEGPVTRLGPKTALAMAMAVHELATNAIKYGALSNETGRVSLSWRVEAAEGVRRFRFQWREIGGPPVTPPKRRGFGSRLIERGLAAEFAGDVRLDFEPEGLVCTIDAALAPTGDFA